MLRERRGNRRTRRIDARSATCNQKLMTAWVGGPRISSHAGGRLPLVGQRKGTGKIRGGLREKGMGGKGIAAQQEGGNRDLTRPTVAVALSMHGMQVAKEAREAPAIVRDLRRGSPGPVLVGKGGGKGGTPFPSRRHSWLSFCWPCWWQRNQSAW